MSETAQTLATEWHRANAYGCKVSPMAPGNGKAACVITVWRKGAPDIKYELPFEFSNCGSPDDLEAFAHTVLVATRGLPFVETDE